MVERGRAYLQQCIEPTVNSVCSAQRLSIMQVNAATLYPTNTKEPTIYPSSPPSRGPSSVPVDTTGDGIADHIGYDTNSDGQLDTFTPIMQHTQPMMQQPYSGHHQPITQQPYSGHHQQQGVQMQMQQQQQGTGTLHIKVFNLFLFLFLLSILLNQSC